jgi:hypothetical protein
MGIALAAFDDPNGLAPEPHFRGLQADVGAHQRRLAAIRGMAA